jgi:putative ABC transport system substrate-binding protein
MEMLKTSLRKLIVAAAVSFIALAAVCRPALAERPNCRIAVVKGSDIPQFDIAIDGFSEVIAGEKIECSVVKYDLGGKVEDVESVIKEIRAFQPDAILTVGTRATRLVSKRVSDIPIVFSMVLYPVASAFVPDMNRPGGNLTGAALDVPIDRQFRTLAEIAPGLRRVGVLYSPKETLQVIEEARRVAASMNLELLAEEINSETEVPDALKRLDRRKMDALWSVADGNVLTLLSRNFIGKYVLSRGIPFMVPHNRFLPKGGALVALTADNRDCGRQAGEIFVRILKGGNPRDIPVATSRTVEMGLNLHVADIIRLKIPQKMIDEASVIPY